MKITRRSFSLSALCAPFLGWFREAEAVLPIKPPDAASGDYVVRWVDQCGLPAMQLDVDGQVYVPWLRPCSRGCTVFALRWVLSDRYVSMRLSAHAGGLASLPFTREQAAALVENTEFAAAWRKLGVLYSGDAREYHWCVFKGDLGDGPEVFIEYRRGDAPAYTRIYSRKFTTGTDAQNLHSYLQNVRDCFAGENSA